MQAIPFPKTLYLVENGFRTINILWLLSMCLMSFHFWHNLSLSLSLALYFHLPFPLFSLCSKTFFPFINTISLPAGMTESPPPSLELAKGIKHKQRVLLFFPLSLPPFVSCSLLGSWRCSRRAIA